MESSKIIKTETSKRLLHVSKSLNFFEDCQNVVIVLKNLKSTIFFLSNEPYSGQKLLKLQSFKAHTAKNNGLFRIFVHLCSQRESNEVKKKHSLLALLSSKKNTFMKKEKN